MSCEGEMESRGEEKVHRNYRFCGAARCAYQFVQQHLLLGQKDLEKIGRASLQALRRLKPVEA